MERTYSFELCPSEQIEAEAFQAKHNASCSFYESSCDEGSPPSFDFLFRFSGNSTLVTIQCCFCGARKNITDYRKW